MTFKFDRKAMARAAEASEQGEHYSVVVSNENYRIGAGARTSDSTECLYFVEVSMKLCQHGPGFDIEALKRLATILESLRCMGYEVGCEMGLVTCERLIPAEEMDKELATVRGMLEL